MTLRLAWPTRFFPSILFLSSSAEDDLEKTLKRFAFHGSRILPDMPFFRVLAHPKKQHVREAL